MNDIIPEGALKTLEERFGSRFVQHTVGEAGAEERVASVSHRMPRRSRR
jgi:hypothetical protein